MEKIFASTDRFFENIELRFGRAAVLILTGVLLLLLTMSFTAVRYETYHHGNAFTRLSEHPFNFETPNDLQLRILSPLLGYLLFFRGPAFKYFMMIILAVFLGFVYFLQRKNNVRPSESIGIAALLALSTLSFNQLYYPAYADPLSYLLIICLFYFYKNKTVAAILLSLMLFNHESNMFLFPFFFLWMADGNYSLKNLSKIFLYFLIAVIPYYLYRKIVLSHINLEYTLSYYIDPANMKWTKEHVLPNLAFGVFQSFRLTWIMPIAAIAIDVYEKRFREILIMLTVFVFVLSQLLVAYDISRLVGLSFPLILISAVRLRQFLGTTKLLVLLYTVFILNFFVPSYSVGANGPESYAPEWMK